MDSFASIPSPKQRKGIKELWARVKALLRSTPSTSRPTTTAVPKIPAEPSLPVAFQTTQSEPPPATLAESSKKSEPRQHIALDESTHKPVTPNQNVIEVDDNEHLEEKTDVPKNLTTPVMSTDVERFDRAQAIFKKYNITLDPTDWRRPSKSSGERVEKKPRIRVRWTCHECKNTFGRDKQCRYCGHSQCTTCIRYPPKKVSQKAKQEKLINFVEQSTTPLTQGACHECKSEFTIGATECTICDHQVCKQCLKETVLESPWTAPPRHTSIFTATDS